MSRTKYEQTIRELIPDAILTQTGDRLLVAIDAHFVATRVSGLIDLEVCASRATAQIHAESMRRQLHAAVDRLFKEVPP